MHAHAREIVAEARLQKEAGRQVDGLTRRAKYFVDNRRRFGLSPATCPDTLSLQALMSVPRLLRLTLRARSTAGASALELWLRHPHHLFGDAVCFLLVDVSRSIYREF
jgi:hypothetical protein